MNYSKLALAITFSLSLAACGGSGGKDAAASNTSTPVTPPRK